MTTTERLIRSDLATHVLSLEPQTTPEVRRGLERLGHRASKIEVVRLLGQMAREGFIARTQHGMWCQNGGVESTHRTRARIQRRGRPAFMEAPRAEL